MFEMNTIFAHKNVRDAQFYVHTFFDLYSFRIIHEYYGYLTKIAFTILNFIILLFSSYLFCELIVSFFVNESSRIVGGI